MTEPAFYEPLGDERYRSTPSTVGPWGAQSQHGGPPSALLARAFERCAPRDDMRIVRVTVDILGAVPVAELAVTARLARPGKRVELLEGSVQAGGREVLRASAWRIGFAEGRAPSVPARHTPPPRPPTEMAFSFPGSGTFGYGSAVEWRFASGAPTELGPAQVWTRLRGSVVAGEAPSGLQRVMAVADSGNGVSASLPLGDWLFINPDLTVALDRHPAGEWVCIEAATSVATDGVGLAASELSDDEGWLGRGLQTLLVAPR